MTTPSAAGDDGRPRSSAAKTVVVPHQPGFWQYLAASLVFAWERLLTRTLRFRWHDASGLFDGTKAEPVIFCTWHNRLALSMATYRLHCKAQQPQRRLAALVSASRDGALLARILENFGVQPVRGSSSRRGAQALLELTSWAERGYDLAITPDGPRGPRYIVQEGAVALAQFTGLPLVPVGGHIRGKICARSWDRFQIPLPFTRCDVFLGIPLRVAKEASDAEREAIRLQLETRLRESSPD